MSVNNFGQAPVKKKLNILNDDIAFVEQYDFSRANMSIENRIHAITSIATICTAQPDAVNKESLYNRLKSESMGLPSSSFEFVPMLIPISEINYRLGVHREEVGDEIIVATDTLDMFKFGIRVEDEKYLLTNYRAVLADFENGLSNFVEYYNTDEKEIEIIRQNFNVFRIKIDLVTRSQLVRHRANIQELSRRYVSGKKAEFEFYIYEKIKDIAMEYNMATEDGHYQPFKIDAEKLIDISLSFYNHLLQNGIKAEQARRFIPQGAYTEIWIGMNNRQLKNFFALRTDIHAQVEIRSLAKAMKEFYELVA